MSLISSDKIASSDKAAKAKANSIKDSILKRARAVPLAAKLDVSHASQSETDQHKEEGLREANAHASHTSALLSPLSPLSSKNNYGIDSGFCPEAGAGTDAISLLLK